MSSVPGAFAVDLRRFAPATRRLRAAAQRYVDAQGLEAVATVAALPCREPGCPPTEVAVQVLAAAPAAFAIRKAPDDVTEAELVGALARALARPGPGVAAKPAAPPMHVADDALEVRREEVSDVVRAVVDATPCVDVHTHLFPAAHGALMLRGLDALLTYHYLVAEYFMVADDIGHAAFYALPVEARAARVWAALFVARTPVSEARIGVLRTLRELGAPRDAMRAARANDLGPLRAWYGSFTPAAHVDTVFRAANVRYVVCTNVPFDADEASRFVDAGCCVDPATGRFRGYAPGAEDAATADGRFRTALRVDAVLAGDWATVAASLRARGLGATPACARLFLAAWARRYGAEYLMASAPGDLVYGAAAPLEPGWPSATRLVDEVLAPVARDLNLPLALKLGCVRNLAPDLAPCGGGDGLRRVDLAPLARLLTRHPRLKVLVTLLGRADQHEACVLAQKFPNLHLYGCWWYCNNPSIIRDVTRMRLEMLGTAFTAQHSDARVLDQLVYKWRHSRTAVAEVLAAQYAHLLGAGWALTRGAVRRDAAALLGGAYEAFLTKTLPCDAPDPG